MQFATCQSRLQHVAGIHRPFCLTCTNHGVNLVDKQDYLTVLLRQLIQYSFQTFLKFAAKFRAGDERTHIQGEHFFVSQTLRHFPVDYPLGKPFNDSCLTYARFANQHRIILGTPLQNLDSTANLVIPAYHGIQLALLSPFSQVNRVLIQSLSSVLSIGISNLVTASHLLNDTLQLLTLDLHFLKEVTDT